jgi:uncharacterized membrane protein
VAVAVAVLRALAAQETAETAAHMALAAVAGLRLPLLPAAARGALAAKA